MKTHPDSFEVDASYRGLVGFGQCEMTPDVGIHFRLWGSSHHEVAKSVHRPLFVTAMSLRRAPDARPIVIAAIDYCWFRSFETANILRRPVVTTHGLADDEFLLVLTHSHAVPQCDVDLESKPGGEKVAAFRAKLIDAMCRAVTAAIDSEAPSIITWGRGVAPLACTRDFVDPASGRILCGPNPSGIADNTLVVGRVVNEQTRRQTGTVVNYACHPVSLGGGNTSISPDYVGSLREVVEANTGGAPCLFLHGPSGNQTPRDSYSDQLQVADANGEILAFSSLATLRSLLPPGERLEFAGIEESGTSLARWCTRSFDVDTTLKSDVRYVQLPSRDWPSMDQIEAAISSAKDGATLTRAARLKDYVLNLQQGLPNGFPIWAVRMGQAILIATPAEPFVELQIALRQRFPQWVILVTNDTNGSFNYLPPASYYGNGAYEQECADFAAGSLEIVIDAASDMIRSLTEESAAAAPAWMSADPEESRQ